MTQAQWKIYLSR